jgi:flagellar biosynthesis/type III secretory pathway protein FliH
MQIDKSEPATPAQEGKTFQEYMKDNKNKGMNAFMNTIEEMNIKFPDKSTEEINELARAKAKDPLPEYYTWDREQFTKKIRELLKEEKEQSTKDTAKSAVSKYYQGGTTALI